MPGALKRWVGSLACDVCEKGPGSFCPALAARDGLMSMAAFCFFPLTSSRFES